MGAAENRPLDRLADPRVVVALVLFAQGLAVVMAFAPGSRDDRFVYFALASLGSQWTLAVFLTSALAARRLIAHLRSDVLAWVALLLLLLSSLGVGLSGWLVLQKFGTDVTSGLSAFLGQIAVVTATLGLFALAGFQWFHRARNMEAAVRDARLESLQARIRPHFLFNTLNTAAALVHDRPESAEDLLLDLSDLFRAALSGPNLIPLEQELALTRRYVHIEQLRFGDRLKIRWELPDALPDVRVPTLSLQPLVENAVRHGIEPSDGGGELLIKVDVGRRTVQILVQNPVVPSRTAPRPGHSIGLASVRARIEALSEGRSRLEVLPGEDVYRVAIVVPLA